MDIRIVALSACVVSCLLCRAGERTLSVTSVARDSAGRVTRAELSLSAGPAAVLYVAWGGSDGGDNPDSWEVCRPVAMIAGSATSYSYEFPRTVGDDVNAARFFLLDGYDAPLSKQYEYVETDGSQYVWTSFTPSGASAVEMDMSLNAVDASVALFGARLEKDGSDAFTLFYIAGQGWRYDYFQVGSAVPPTAEPKTRYLLRADKTGLALNGTPVDSKTAKTKMAGSPLLLFGAAYGKDGTPEYKPSLKLYSFKAWADSSDECSLSLDLVPTEKDGVTCLYNKVDGSYLSSGMAGHGFAHGAEIPVVRATVLSQTASIAGKFGAERTICIAAKRRDGPGHRLTGVDLSFTTGLDRQLYVGYGSANGGDAMPGWEHVEKVAAVAGDETGYAFVVPETWGADVKAMRFFLCDKDYVPCDALYESVTVDGVYVNTGFTPQGLSQIDMSLAFSTVEENQAVFCARRSNDNKESMTVFYLSTGWRFDYDWAQDSSSVTVEPERRYDIRVASAKLFVNGDPVASCTLSATLTAGSALTLFDIASGTRPKYPFKGVFYSFRAQQTDDASTLQLDLVPCLKDGKVRLYNKVDGTRLDFVGNGTVTPGLEVPNGVSVAETDVLGMDPPGLIILFK